MALSMAAAFQVHAVVANASPPHSNTTYAAREGALIGAVEAGDAKRVAALLDDGGNPNITDGNGRPLITLVTRAPVTKIIKAMNRNGECRTIKHHRGHAAIVELLIKHGADVNAKDRVGWTPLLQAMACDEKELADSLKAFGAKR